MCIRDSVWFVLTGAMPAVRGLDISVYRNAAEDSVDSYVEIRMLPWIDPDTVRAAIIGFRRDLARAGRAIGDRGFRLVDFVISRARPDIAPNDRLWKRLHTDWNACPGTKAEFRNAPPFRPAWQLVPYRCFSSGGFPNPQSYIQSRTYVPGESPAPSGSEWQPSRLLQSRL